MDFYQAKAFELQEQVIGLQKKVIELLEKPRTEQVAAIQRTLDRVIIGQPQPKNCTYNSNSFFTGCINKCIRFKPNGLSAENWRIRLQFEFSESLRLNLPIYAHTRDAMRAFGLVTKPTEYNAYRDFVLRGIFYNPKEREAIKKQMLIAAVLIMVVVTQKKTKKKAKGQEQPPLPNGHTRIHFADNGQDFLTWTLNPEGTVIECNPMQGRIWIGTKVINHDRLTVNRRAEIQTGNSKCFIIHKIECIERPRTATK